MKTFHISVVAPSRPLLSIEAVSARVPGTSGDLGVMAGREPILASLRPGLIRIETAHGEALWFAVTGGFFEMIDDHVTVLADQLFSSEEARFPIHLKGKPLFIPGEFASEVQKEDLVQAMICRKTSGEQ